MIEQIAQVVGSGFVQALIVLLLAPLLQGIIKKCKARLQNRIGASVFQPYYDIIKYMKKDAIFSEHTSWLSVITPYITFTAMVTASLFIPTFVLHLPFSFWGDLILVIYLFGVARFFTAIAALDAGGSFGGMGSSREMALSAIAEPALLLAAFAVLLTGKTTKLNGLMQMLSTHHDIWLKPSYILAFLAMFIVLLAETGRIPVDNPDTHLELTMIHEGMLLEYSGRYLGLMLWAAQVKQMLLISLFIDLFLPWGIAESGLGIGILLALLLYLVKLVLFGILLAVIETLYAKIRLFKVPKLLGSSMVLSILAILIQAVE